jgi:transposase InsO family protein
VAAVIDLFSRRVVGWSMSRALTAQLVTDTLVMESWRRRGTQYTASNSQQLPRRPIDAPLGKRLGNAAIEVSSFRSSPSALRQHVRQTRVTREPMCSTTLSASTMQSADARGLAI